MPFFVDDSSAIAGVPKLLFAALAAYSVAPMFMRAAKRAQNRVIGPLLIAICACPFLCRAGIASRRSGAQNLALPLAADLQSLLMLLMGGRAISPAVVGYHCLRGGYLEARVQPRLERPVTLFMLASAACDLLPGAAAAACGQARTVHASREDSSRRRRAGARPAPRPRPLRRQGFRQGAIGRLNPRCMMPINSGRECRLRPLT